MSVVEPADFGFFLTLSDSDSLSAAAREMGLTPAAVSKRLMLMERRAGVTLMSRTTRSMTLTPEGKLYLKHTRRILHEIDTLDELLIGASQRPAGLLRVSATLGFGRKKIAPAVSQFVSDYPNMSVQLQLSVVPPPLTASTFDIYIRFGKPPDSRVIARRLAQNRRLLCATPGYLSRHGVPVTPQDLKKHNCIDIREGYDKYGVWRFSKKQGTEKKMQAVHINGSMATNDGEVAVNWALNGHGILMRSEWSIQEHLADGRLEIVLPDYATPDADIYAVYTRSQRSSYRIRAFNDFLVHWLQQHCPIDRDSESFE